MISRQSINILLASTCLLGGSCYAQIVADKHQPVNIKSNKVEFDHKNGVATYIGNVQVDQGSRHLYSEKLVIKRDHNNKIKVIIATGKPAKFDNHPNPDKPISFGQATTIKYYPQQEKVDLLDDAELTQNGDTIKGPLLKYDLSTETLKSRGSAQERTTVIIQPKRKS